MSKRAAIYVRVSTDEQAEAGLASLPHQEAECRKLAERLGLTVTTVHRDEVSGQTTNRPGLLRLLADLPETDAVLCYDITRLGRNRAVLSTLRQMLEDARVSLRLVQGDTADLDDEASPILEAVGDALSEIEVKRFVRRSRMGKVGKAKRGQWVGGRVAYGYRADPEAPGGLAVDDGQAPIIRRIFSMYVDEGLSARAIAETLTREGIQTHTGRAAWGKSAVWRILTNQTYAGLAHYGRTDSRGKDQGRAVKPLPPSEWIGIPVTPIIDQDAFDAAQRRLAKNLATMHRPAKRFYLLSGMIFCAGCGRPYGANADSRQGRVETLSYRHRVKDGGCCNHQVLARKLEPVVWDEVSRALLDSRLLGAGFEAMTERQLEDRTRNVKRVEGLRAALVKLDAKDERLRLAYIDPDIGITKAQYIKDRDAIAGDRAKRLGEIATLEAEVSAMPEAMEWADIDALAADVRLALAKGGEAVSPEEKRQILQALDARVMVGVSGETWVEGWFTGGRIGKVSRGQKRSGLPAAGEARRPQSGHRAL